MTARCRKTPTDDGYKVISTAERKRAVTEHACSTACAAYRGARDARAPDWEAVRAAAHTAVLYIDKIAASDISFATSKWRAVGAAARKAASAAAVASTVVTASVASDWETVRVAARKAARVAYDVAFNTAMAKRENALRDTYVAFYGARADARDAAHDIGVGARDAAYDAVLRAASTGCKPPCIVDQEIANIDFDISG